MLHRVVFGLVLAGVKMSTRFGVGHSAAARRAALVEMAHSRDPQLERGCWPETWTANDLQTLKLCPRVFPSTASDECKKHYKTQYRVKCNATKPWELGTFGRGIWPTTVPWKCNVRPMQVSKKPVPKWTTAAKKWKLLIGAMSVAGDYERRRTIRSTWIYGASAARGPKEIRGMAKPAVVFFVIGIKADKDNKPLTDEAMCHLKAEQDKYGDLILLNIKENMNLGKTNDWFQLAYRKFSAEYVMKADTDAFLNIPSLLNELSFLPSCRLYFGFPCEHPPGDNNRESPHKGLGLEYGSFEIPAGTGGGILGVQAAGWMCGMGFVLSWDLVEFLATDEIVARDSSRYASYAGEDIQMGLWLTVGGIDLNFAGDYFKFMDYSDNPRSHDAYHHEMLDDTVLIHEIKQEAQWEKVHGRYDAMSTKDQFSTDLIGTGPFCSETDMDKPGIGASFYSTYAQNCTWCLGPEYSCDGCIPTMMKYFTNRSL
jgi:hypothetical protein